jgi:arginyl-tRNA synthetase
VYKCIYQWIYEQISPICCKPPCITFNDNYLENQRGQFQTSVAFTIAKELKLSPYIVAQEIASQVQVDGLHCFATEPGFINFIVEDWMLLNLLKSNDLSKNHCTVVVDFGGPNIAKPMHIGHIRSFLMGESVRRLYEYLGYTVISDIHLGDCGTQMGMVALGFTQDFPESPFLNQNNNYPSILPFNIEYLARVYPEMSAKCRYDPLILAEAKRLTYILQNKSHSGLNAWWNLVKDLSIKYIKNISDSLECHFTLWMGESDVLIHIHDMLEQATTNNLCKEDAGCKVIPLSSQENLLVQKSDGGYVYATTDLATIQWRIKQYQPERIIYVADKRQSKHFKDVFAAAEILHIAPDVTLQHVGFGMVTDQQGRPYKTRDGSALSLESMIEAAKQHVRIQGQDSTAIALSTIKFAILSVRSDSILVFSPEVFTQYEGKTGAYLMYTHIRIKSLLAKIDGTPQEDLGINQPTRMLMLYLTQFKHYMLRAQQSADTSILCDYSYLLSQTFNHLYHEHHILTDPLNTRVVDIINQVYKVLEDIIYILGMYKATADM